MLHKVLPSRVILGILDATIWFGFVELFCSCQVDIGLCADLGTLQRLPKLIGSESLARELVFTARK